MVILRSRRSYGSSSARVPRPQNATEPGRPSVLQIPSLAAGIQVDDVGSCFLPCCTTTRLACHEAPHTAIARGPSMSPEPDWATPSFRNHQNPFRPPELYPTSLATPTATRSPLLPEVPVPPGHDFAALSTSLPNFAPPFSLHESHASKHIGVPSSTSALSVGPSTRDLDDYCVATTAPPWSPVQNYARSSGVTLPMNIPAYNRTAPAKSAYFSYPPTSPSRSAPSGLGLHQLRGGGASPGSDALQRGQGSPFALEQYADSDGEDDQGSQGGRRRRRRQTEPPRDAHLRNLPCPICEKKFARVSTFLVTGGGNDSS